MLLFVLFGSPSVHAAPQEAGQTPTEAPGNRLQLPDPTVLLAPDTISFAVLTAQAQDEGFREMLDIAWRGLQNARGTGTAPFMKLLLRAMSSQVGAEENGLLSFLPIQMVRTDALGSGETVPHPSFAVTVAGWPGLQQIFMTGMMRDRSGEPYPVEKTADANLIYREGWEEPGTARVLTRLHGTFLAFPDKQRALTGVKRFAQQQNSGGGGLKAELEAGLDRSHNTYGVLVNRDGSLLNFLRWLNKADVHRAEQAVGAERLRAVLERVEAMTWEGNLVNADEFDFKLRFLTADEKTRQELTEVLKEVRTVLDDYGRAGEMQATGMDRELFVDFTMVGYRQMLESYLETF